MAKMIAEFKAFAFRGQLIDLAVAVILGLAFSAVVQALADGILMQIIAAVFGQPDFNSLSIDLGDTPIRYGLFITALVNFILIALVLFFVVRTVNRMMRPRGATDEPPTTRECPYCFTVVPVAATRCSGCTSTLQAEPA
jgi:large conductance mechanosensitive channel